MLSLLTSWITPLGISITLFIFGLYFMPTLRALRIATSVSLALLIFFSLPYISQAIVYTLERRAPQLSIDAIPSADIAILLGGGVKVPYGYRQRPELGQWGDRLAFTAELYRKRKIKTILVSAGNDHTSTTGLSESELTKNILANWGVDSADIIVESISTSTYENALYTAPIVNKTDPKIVFLISSAFHLPRAHALYCSVGVSTIPLPSNHMSSGSIGFSDMSWLPLASSLHVSTIALKEYSAMFYYGLTGKISLSTIWAKPTCS